MIRTAMNVDRLTTFLVGADPADLKLDIDSFRNPFFNGATSRPHRANESSFHESSFRHWPIVSLPKFE